LATLLVLGACSCLLVGMVGIAQTELQRGSIVVEQDLVDVLTASALAFAKDELRRDDPECDYLSESWAQPVDLRELGCFTKLHEALGYSVEVSCRIVDEAGKLNLNLASTDSLADLGLAEHLGVIQDWIDEDEDVSTGGAESDAYLQMDPPYRCKNKPFQFVEELVFLRGVTLSTVEGEDANGNGLLDPNEQDGDDSYPPDNADDLLDLGARDLLTALGDGRVNLNTAPVQTLAAIPGIRDETAQAIDAWRRGPDAEPGTIDDRVLRDIQELDQFDFLNEFELLMLRGLGVCASSDFRVFVRVLLPDRGKVFGTTILLRRQGRQVREVAKLRMSDSGPSWEVAF